ncbi:hypothetical protein R9X47_22835 [Wukongibacter baidiensis]|uniref:hypothetical protein n=1 Tax=Wukongibacter baidiensis TaxID=1723361 RepID=UPI003D7F234A
MKRTIVTILIMCMFLSCMSFSYAEEKGAANKLEGFDEALEHDDSKTGNFAVVLYKHKGLRLWTESGDDPKYDVDKYENGLRGKDIDKGDIIKYILNDDGSINVIAKVYDAKDNKALGENAKLVKLSEINKDNVEDHNNYNYFHETDSIYIDYSKYKDSRNSDDLEVLDWNDFKQIDFPSDDSDNAVLMLIVTDEEEDDEIELLAFIENYDEIYDEITENTSYVGYLLNYKTDDDIMTVTVDVFGQGEKEYNVTDDDDQDEIKDYGIEELIVFVLRDGELKLKDPYYNNHKHYGNADGGKMWFKEKDGNDIIVYAGNENTLKEYEVHNEVVIYNNDDEKNLNKINEGDALEFIIRNGEIIAIKYTEEEDLDEDKKLKEYSSRKFGVLIRKNSGIEYELKLWTETSDTIIYDVDDFKNGTEFIDLHEGDIIEYLLNDDGTIDVIAKVYDAEENKAVAGNSKLVKLDEINKDNLEDEDGDNYFNQGTSLYFDYSKYKTNLYNDHDDLDVLDWDDFKNADVPSADSNNAVVALIVTDEDEDDEIELLAFIENYDEIDDNTDDNPTTSPGNFAVLIKKDSGLDDEFKLWIETGETVKYDIDDYENKLDYDDFNIGDIIEYSLEDDGTIDVIAKIYDASSGEAVGGKNVKLVKLDEINKDNVEDEDRDNYYDQSDSVYFDYSEYKENDHEDDDDLDVLKWKDFEDLDIPSADSSNAVVALIVANEDEDDEIRLLAFIDNYDEIDDNDSSENDTYVGYLLGYVTDDDIMTVTVDVFGEGEKEYNVTDDDDQDEIKDYGIEELIVFVLRDGELKLKDFDNNNELHGDADGGEMWFCDKDGSDITVYVGNENTIEEYEVHNEVVIYHDDNAKNLNRINEGDAIEFILRDGQIIAIKYQEKEDLDEDKQLKINP